MNNALLQLKLKTLLSKYNYYSNEIEYKTEIVHNAEPKFLEEIGKLLKDNPILYEKFNNIINPQKINVNFKKHNNSTSGNDNDNDKNVVKEKTPSSEFEQKIFHEISKQLHPDKLKNPSNKQIELYSEASDAYSSHDIITLYKTAIELDIEVIIDENVIKQVEQQIEKMEEKTNFIEKNLAYQWLIAVEEQERLRILKFYIENVINK
jgi:hypothetical protein